MIMRVRSLFEKIFKKASLARTGRLLPFFRRASPRARGVLSLAPFIFLIFAPPIFADANPGNNAGAMTVRIRPKNTFPPVPVTDLDAAITFNEWELLLQ